MKQFGKILKFELKNYFTNKVFVGITLFFVLAITVVMFFPRISETFDKEDNSTNVESYEDVEELPVMLVAGENAEYVSEIFSASFLDYKVEAAQGSVDDIKERIVSGDAECAFVMSNPTEYTYYVNNLSMMDMNTQIADEVLLSVYRMGFMVGNGISAEQAEEVLSAQIQHETQTLGKDQFQNYLYTYIMIMALYMVILLYGQMVANNVATEKSSRAMELLITSANPVSMMFGKVIASCTAGFVQLVSIFGSALLFFNINKSYWEGADMIESLFDMPVDLLIYMLVFFVLGFLIYAFMFSAVGSTASKLEDINTSVTPIVLIFVAGFIVVMVSMGTGNFDTTLIKVCSYIPFTSPMVMFARVVMTTVPVYEIAISIAILIASVIGIGVVSAKIYRVGVLLYGTPPKISAIIKAIRKA
ncbi:MAG: ABC transporter permease [Clostridia bacterium]|nr:ABC transporter permease [Clostridia bacterium]